MQTDRTQGSRDDLRIERDHTCCQRREHKDPGPHCFFASFLYHVLLLHSKQRFRTPVDTVWIQEHHEKRS